MINICRILDQLIHHKKQMWQMLWSFIYLDFFFGEWKVWKIWCHLHFLCFVLIIRNLISYWVLVLLLYYSLPRKVLERFFIIFSNKSRFTCKKSAVLNQINDEIKLTNKNVYFNYSSMLIDFFNHSDKKWINNRNRDKSWC